MQCDVTSCVRSCLRLTGHVFLPPGSSAPLPLRKSPPRDPPLMMTTLLLFSLSNAMRVLNGRNSTARRLDFFLFSRFPLVFRIFFFVIFSRGAYQALKAKKVFHSQSHSHQHTSATVSASKHLSIWKKKCGRKKNMRKNNGRGKVFLFVLRVCLYDIFNIFALGAMAKQEAREKLTKVTLCMHSCRFFCDYFLCFSSAREKESDMQVTLNVAIFRRPWKTLPLTYRYRYR